MGSKSAQSLMLMPNLLSDYVGYILNLCILAGGPSGGSDVTRNLERPPFDWTI